MRCFLNDLFTDPCMQIKVSLRCRVGVITEGASRQYNSESLVGVCEVYLDVCIYIDSFDCSSRRRSFPVDNPVHIFGPCIFVAVHVWYDSNSRKFVKFLELLISTSKNSWSWSCK
jgi:hypothetical protein